MNTYICGDIHGCIDTLLALVDRINPTDSDQFIFVGDLIDRGPDCVRTVMCALTLPNAVIVRGNHEDKFLRWAFGDEKRRAAIKLWPGSDYEALIRADLHLDLSTTKFHHQAGEFFIIHAGIPVNFSLENQSNQRKNVLGFTRWLDEQGRPIGNKEDEKRPGAVYWDTRYDGRYGFAIYGHQKVHPVRLGKYSLGIDTGCQSGGQLTAVNLEKLGPALRAIQQDEYAWPEAAIQECLVQVSKCETKPDKYLDPESSYL